MLTTNLYTLMVF